MESQFQNVKRGGFGNQGLVGVGKKREDVQRELYGEQKEMGDLAVSFGGKSKKEKRA